MSATAFEFELGDIDQGAPLELADREGGGVKMLLREGTPITSRLIGQLNDLLGCHDYDGILPSDATTSDPRWLIALALALFLAYRTLRGPPKRRPRDTHNISPSAGPRTRG